MSGPAPGLRCAVVLCTYNGARFLPQQLESLRAQTVQPAQYVLSDDASSDDTWAMLQAFASERMAAGCEVILHRNEDNLGYVRHFEQALQRADAEVLLPCDQDDVWHPGKIARMAEVFAARPGLLMLHADARLVDGEGKPSGRGLFEVLEVTADEMQAMHEGRAFDVLLRRNIVTGAVMALRRRLLEGAFPVGDGWAHDEWLAMLAAMQGEADTLDEAWVDYRQHGGNQIGVRERSAVQKHLGIGVGRREFLRRLVGRQESLLAHLQSQGVGDERLGEVRDRLAHARLRAGLDSKGWARLRDVMAEWRTGRYARYGSGWRSVMSDWLGLD